jgi:deoxyadenosine/deoxycytidine kinase
MIIEFIGVPASGKTTVAQILVNELKNKGHEVELQFPIDSGFLKQLSRKTSKLLLCLRMLFQDFEYSYNLGRFLAANRSIRLARKLNLYTNALYIGSLERKASKSDSITVFHQGYLQFIYSVGKVSEEHNFDASIQTMIPWNPAPDLVVLITAEAELVEKRLANRSRKERNREGHISSKSDINLSERLMKKLTIQLTNKSVPWISLGSDDAEVKHADVSEIVHLIETLMPKTASL